MLSPSAYYPAVGGVEELTRKLAAEYKKRGHQVLIITSKLPRTSFSEIVDGITVRRFYFFTPARKVFNILRFVLMAPLELLRLLISIKIFNPSVIHVQCNGSNTYYMYLAAKLLKIKLVDTLQGETKMDEHRIYQHSFFFPFALRRILKQAAVVTGCSQEVLNDAAKYAKLGLKAQVIFNGVDLKEFQVETRKLKEIYIFTTGRFTYNKGFDLLVKTFQKILPKHKGLKLFIGGDGKDRPALEKYLQTIKLTGDILLLGRLSRRDTVRYMKNALFVVMPSRYEPFGIVALEALAAGKAILATQNGGPPEFIEPGKAGYLVDPENQKDFTAKLELMFKNYKRLEKNARSIARKFDWTVIAEKYLQIY